MCSHRGLLPITLVEVFDVYKSMRRYQKSCVMCDAKFVATRRDARHCSHACASLAHRRRVKQPTQFGPHAPCAGCAGAMTGKRWDALYCSKNCASLKWYQENKNLRSRSGRVCPTCRSGVDEGRHSNAVYCSTSCREVDRRVREHGMTFAQYESLLLEQNNRCAVCGVDESGLWHARDVKRDGWHIDHDHSTGAVRGILCPPCNLMIGYANDDPDRLVAAAVYLVVRPYHPDLVTSSRPETK